MVWVTHLSDLGDDVIDDVRSLERQKKQQLKSDDNILDGGRVDRMEEIMNEWTSESTSTGGKEERKDRMIEGGKWKKKKPMNEWKTTTKNEACM